MRLAAILFICVTCFVIYSNALGGQFVWDDEYFVVNNTALRSLGNFSRFFTDASTVAPGDLAHDVYRPLTTLSYAVDYRLWKLDSFMYHSENVPLHAINSILVLLVVYAIFGNIALAFLASLLFLTHPVQTEAVSWISGRSSLLFLAFYLASFLLYVRFTREPAKRLLLSGSAGFFALSMFSKEMAASLPLLIIAYDMYFPTGKRFWKRAVGYIPYVAIVITYIFIRGSLLETVSQMGWWGGGWSTTFYTMTKALMEYIAVLVFPLTLCARHIIGLSVSWAEPAVLISIAILGLITLVAWALFRKQRGLSFAVAWIFITLLPVSNIIPLKALMAERFLYLPSIGFCLLAALLIEKLRRRSKLVAIAVAVALIMVYSMRTVIRNEDWKTAVSISQKTLQVSPFDPWVFTSLGAYYMDRDEVGKALQPLRKAAALGPNFALARSSLGACYLKLGRFDDAAKELAKAVSLRPDRLDTYNMLGVAYASLGRIDDAIGEFTTVLQKDPAFLNAYLNLGRIYEMRGEWDKALEQYNAIIARATDAGDKIGAYIRIGDTFHAIGQSDNAKASYQKALGLCAGDQPEVRNLIVDRIKGLE
jgi:protein O-mannosyl-transferase